MVNGLTDQQLEAGFIASDEFFAKSGGTDATWVNALYQSLLGRPADPSGEAFWTQQLANGVTRDSVAFGFADSTEREGQLVESDYEHSWDARQVPAKSLIGLVNSRWASPTRTS